MCGIVGYIGSKEATPILVNGLSKLEYRGYDSAGVALFNKEQLDVVKTKGRLVNLAEKLVSYSITATMGIGHTRWATHGAPSDENSHPHFNKDKTIAVVHNGIIENHVELREELKQKGYTFLSQTDTEVVAHLVDFYYEGNLVEAFKKTVDRLEGAYALGCISKDHPDVFVAVRKDSPLVVGLGNGENFIASDIPAILEYTRDVYLLNDNEFVILTRDKVRIEDRNGNEIKRDIYKVTWDIAAAEKGGYEHFMLKEIHEQPKAVRDTLLPRLPEGTDNIKLDEIKLSKEELDKINKIYIVACGTAAYAGQIGKYLIERIARIPVVAEIASEFRYRDPIMDENTLMIVVSQSGETADTLAALRAAKAAGARVVGVVNVVGSSMAREADDLLYTWAGPEIAVASTKAYSTQVVAMYLLACHIAMETGKMSKEDFAEIKKEMVTLPEKIQTILDQEEKIKALANQYKNSKNVFYLGRGLDFAVSLEGSLKLKEIAYVHSEPYAAGELKHGPIALIEEGTLVVGLVSQEELFEKTASNLAEVKARGARILAIAQEGYTEIENTADEVIYVPRTHWMLTPVLVNIPQQLFAYYIAVGLGHDVDKPRNLAKSVTVE